MSIDGADEEEEAMAEVLRAQLVDEMLIGDPAVDSMAAGVGEAPGAPAVAAAGGAIVPREVPLPKNLIRLPLSRDPRQLRDVEYVDDEREAGVVTAALLETARDPAADASMLLRRLATLPASRDPLNRSRRAAVATLVCDRLMAITSSEAAVRAVLGTDETARAARTVAANLRQASIDSATRRTARVAAGKDLDGMRIPAEVDDGLDAGEEERMELTQWQASARLDLLLCVAGQRDSCGWPARIPLVALDGTLSTHPWLLSPELERRRDAPRLTIPAATTVMCSIATLITNWRADPFFHPDLAAYVGRIHRRMCALLAYAETPDDLASPTLFPWLSRLGDKVTTAGAGGHIHDHPMFYKTIETRVPSAASDAVPGRRPRKPPKVLVRFPNLALIREHQTMLGALLAALDPRRFLTTVPRTITARDPPEEAIASRALPFSGPTSALAAGLPERFARFLPRDLSASSAASAGLLDTWWHRYGTAECMRVLALCNLCLETCDGQLSPRIMEEFVARLYGGQLVPSERERMMREDTMGSPASFGVLAKFRRNVVDIILAWTDAHPRAIQDVLERAADHLRRALGLQVDLPTSTASSLSAAAAANGHGVSSLERELAAMRIAEEREQEELRQRVPWPPNMYAVIELAVSVALKYAMDSTSESGALAAWMLERHRRADLLARSTPDGLYLVQFHNAYDIVRKRHGIPAVLEARRTPTYGRAPAVDTECLHLFTAADWLTQVAASPRPEAMSPALYVSISTVVAFMNKGDKMYGAGATRNQDAGQRRFRRAIAAAEQAVATTGTSAAARAPFRAPAPPPGGLNF